jgi:aspartate 1-decarboxylase
MQLRTFLRAKIHRATVTAADLDYVGSVTIDGDLMDAADLDHLERVDVFDITNGARLTTYALRGPRGSGEVQINGAAAHLISTGHVVTIMAFALDADLIQPKRILLNERNEIVSDKVL